MGLPGTIDASVYSGLRDVLSTVLSEIEDHRRAFWAQ